MLLVMVLNILVPYGWFWTFVLVGWGISEGAQYYSEAKDLHEPPSQQGEVLYQSTIASDIHRNWVTMVDGQIHQKHP